MKPAARLAAAIDVLDLVVQGQPAEQALINWGRRSRFAGSGDRSAVRDLVFSALRCRRSFAAMGGGDTGRGLIIGALRSQGLDPQALFDGSAHAPTPLTPAESAFAPAEGLAALDCPDWLGPILAHDLGADFAAVMRLMQSRAPLFLRVNLARATSASALAALASEAIAAEPHPLARTALIVTENARKVQTSRAYLEGLVEIQDAASQAILEGLPIEGRVLDYCAGGGGKALALAAAGAQVWAHDADPARLRDLPTRAARAGTPVQVVRKVSDLYNLILLDVPCSGSGAWRRSPEGKWALTPARLAALLALQARILDEAQGHVALGGHLAYATCSVLRAENAGQIEAFTARHPQWRVLHSRCLSPLEGGDGFFITLLTRDPPAIYTT